MGAHLFYRASPGKESLGSRIGHATLALTPEGEPAPGATWVDDPANPVLRPTLDDELFGTEDPKVFRAEGHFWLFYNGVFPITEEARVAARLTQGEVGRRAGLPQSAVSRYEGGSKIPSLPVLERLFEAAGLDLALTLTPSRPRASTAASSFAGPVGCSVQPRRAELRSFFAHEGFGSPQVFGSVSRGDDRADSDLDVVPRDGLTPEVAEAVSRDGVAL
ncbi:helix-turn-helix domain-containing protein [Frigoribacterium sp. PhB24]|uniref:helix-turn-helix domain-containing protein n=1 Tax=Frigoribacterium sp. PhB24 TaxID=2485204 RepID=UPI000FBF08D0|nr:helix-turn-helix domain-containing protein [Frigoribacterium sp. PhB24]ROS50541.1 helix-turn-helix protein [Frigoribacterium sp. PhB24]